MTFVETILTSAFVTWIGCGITYRLNSRIRSKHDPRVEFYCRVVHNAPCYQYSYHSYANSCLPEDHLDAAPEQYAASPYEELQPPCVTANAIVLHKGNSVAKNVKIRVTLGGNTVGTFKLAFRQSLHEERVTCQPTLSADGKRIDFSLSHLNANDEIELKMEFVACPAPDLIRAEADCEGLRIGDCDNFVEC